jgi:hypothetical protein
MGNRLNDLNNILPSKNHLWAALGLNLSFSTEVSYVNYAVLKYYTYNIATSHYAQDLTSNNRKWVAKLL